MNQAIRIDDAQLWDDTLLSLPNPHALQSWAWGDFKARHGWSAVRMLHQEEGSVIGAAQVLRRRVPRLPLSILYVPKGPTLDWSNTAHVDLVLSELESLARQWRALFVKIDPDVHYPDDVPEFSPHPALAPHLAQCLQQRGWRYSSDQVQFRNTLLTDLTRPEEALLAAMKQKTRYNIRLATRRGVTVREGTVADLDLFYRLYAETSQRDGFLIRPADYYRDAWGTWLQAGQACLLFAEVEGETVAGLILVTFGATAWYMYGASSSRHRKHMPNQLLQWEAIRWAKSAGCSLYDLWGAPEELDESDPMWGVVRFKMGLGGQLARGLGAWDYAPHRLTYRAYIEVMPRYLGLLRRVSRLRSTTWESL